MSSFPYKLSMDSYLCLADDLLVFSSLKDDKYRCLSRSNTRAALRAIPSLNGYSTTPASSISEGEEKQARQVLLALISSGILTNDCTLGKPITVVDIPRPTSSLLPHSCAGISPNTTIGHWVSFMSASFSASRKLRMQSLQKTVRSVEKRKQRGGDSRHQNNETLHLLVSHFHHLRPYYIRRYLCRFDSLALVEFLARYRFYPDWVFGVRGEPFGAHCWVQEDDLVLNDSVEYISQFTPIMAF